MKKFHNDRQIQVYMYDFMYVYTETIPEEIYSLDTRTYDENYKNGSTNGPAPKHCIGFN